MSSVNRVTILGRVGRDPEVKNFSNGGRIVTFSIATSDTWKDKGTGQRKERVEWHNVTVNNEGIAKIVEQYVRKGSRIFLVGSLQTRKWQDQSGQDRYSTEVVIKPFSGELVLLDSPDNRSDKPQGGNSTRPAPQSAQGYYDDLDSEIPF